MPLKIELKPHESIIIGESLITNDNERTRFYIEGNVPILREKFILRESEANTPSKRVYFIVQQMYLAKDASAIVCSIMTSTRQSKVQINWLKKKPNFLVKP